MDIEIVRVLAARIYEFYYIKTRIIRGKQYQKERILKFLFFFKLNFNKILF
jgi:hypothetical protein